MHWGAAAVPPELEGASFVPLLQNGSPPGKQRVFSQYPHSLVRGASQHGFANASGPVMGYTMRTAGASVLSLMLRLLPPPPPPPLPDAAAPSAEWRYTEWAHFPCGAFLDDPMNCTSSSDPRWDLVYGVELYNHTGDPSVQNPSLLAWRPRCHLIGSSVAAFRPA